MANIDEQQDEEEQADQEQEKQAFRDAYVKRQKEGERLKAEFNSHRAANIDGEIPRKSQS